MGTVKDTTHEIVFDEDYPVNVPCCEHGPALKLKSFKKRGLYQESCSIYGLSLYISAKKN